MAEDYKQIVKTPLLDVVRAACLDGNRVLLVQEADDPNWKLPGGKIHIGETIYEALVREIKEELGVELEETMIANYVSANIPDSHHIRHIFLLSRINPADIKPTSEVKEAKYFDLDSLPDTKFVRHILSAVKIVTTVDKT